MPGTGKSLITAGYPNIFSFQYLIYTAILFYLCFFFFGTTFNNINMFNTLTLTLYEEA